MKEREWDREKPRGAKVQVDHGRVPPSLTGGDGREREREKQRESWLSASATVGTEFKHVGPQIKHGCSWWRFQEASVNTSLQP